MIDRVKSFVEVGTCDVNLPHKISDGCSSVQVGYTRLTFSEDLLLG